MNMGEDPQNTNLPKIRVLFIGLKKPTRSLEVGPLFLNLIQSEYEVLFIDTPHKPKKRIS